MSDTKKYNYLPRFVEVWSGAQRLSEKDVRVRRMLIPIYSIDFINLETRFSFSKESPNLTKAGDTRVEIFLHGKEEPILTTKWHFNFLNASNYENILDENVYADLAADEFDTEENWRLRNEWLEERKKQEEALIREEKANWEEQYRQKFEKDLERGIRALKEASIDDRVTEEDFAAYAEVLRKKGRVPNFTRAGKIFEKEKQLFVKWWLKKETQKQMSEAEGEKK